MPTDSLDVVFLGALSASARAQASKLEDLDRSLAEIVGRARASWPVVTLDPHRFVEHLARALPDGDLRAELGRIHASDLYLACALGEPKAIASMQAAYLADLDRTLSRVGISGDEVNEIRSQVCEHVLLPRESGRPKIIEYAGRGSLHAWLHVVATRIALSHKRSQREDPTEDVALMADEAQGSDPELAYLKDKYRKEFSAAFQKAMQALSSRDRNLLRQHYLDGLSFERIAGLYHVHRATAVRWIADARQGLLSATRDAMMRRLSVQRFEADSILRLIQSQLNASISLFFTGRGEGSGSP